MRNELWAAMSFAATILFGLLALLALFVAGLALGNHAIVACALLACGAAYLSQLLATFRKDALALVLQFVALALWLGGFLTLPGVL